LLDGRVVGATASVVYGHTIGKILAFAYIKPDAATAGRGLEVVIAGTARPARILTKAAYDPQSLRPRSDETSEAVA